MMSFKFVQKMCLKYLVFGIVCSSLALASENSVSLESKLNWECANNATCLDNVKNDFLKGLQERKSFNFDGLFSIEPTGDTNKPISEGRGFMSNIFSGNSLRIPLGGFALTVERSAEHKDYLEVALIKNSEEGRRRNSLGGGGGGGGGGVGTRKSKKYLQTFIPLFLAFNAVGWLLLAVKAVAVLTLKALLVSKLALIVAGTTVFKKLMDSATEKMIASHQFDHGSVSDHMVLPYNMEYNMALPSHNYHTTSELNGSDLFSVQIPNGQEALAAHGLGGGESVSAESQVNQVVSSLTNASKGSVLGIQSVPKVKRQDDIWTGYLKKPMFYNAAANAAAAAAAASATNPMYFYGKA